VRARQRLDDLSQQVRKVRLLNPAAPLRCVITERDNAGLHPLHQLHPQPVAPSRLPKLIHPHDVRMFQVGHHLGFAPESHQRFRAPGEVFGQQLQGVAPPQREVLGFIHLAHAAAAQQAEDVV
jgi:hypothetical protein